VQAVDTLERVTEMKNVVRSLVVAALVVAMTQSAFAADKKKGNAKSAPGQSFGAYLKKRLESAQLSDEQKKEVDAILDKLRPDFVAALKQIGAIQKDINAARKKAVDEGKKGKEVNSAIDAVEMTDEQRTGLKMLREVNAGARQAIVKVLTEEQLGKSGLAPKKKKNK
jgi:hypothetical protein